MLFSYVFALLISATSVLAQRQCGAVFNKEDIQAAEKIFQAHKKKSGGKNESSVLLNLYWHVIRLDETLAGGNIEQKQIVKQIQVLNDGLRASNTGVQFTLADVDRTTNDSWFHANAGSLEQEDMKTALRQGGVTDYNVYSVNFTNCACGAIPVTGFSTMPSQYSGQPQLDGSIVLFSSLPGGTTKPFNLGMTLLHEFGHWGGGLFHTFQGDNCSGFGDLIDDTPAEASATIGCPKKRDSCPDDPGLDPIHNYMDFSDDDCMNNFTPDQVTRMREQMAIFRGIDL